MRRWRKGKALGGRRERRMTLLFPREKKKGTAPWLQGRANGENVFRGANDSMFALLTGMTQQKGVSPTG